MELVFYLLAINKVAIVAPITKLITIIMIIDIIRDAPTTADN